MSVAPNERGPLAREAIGAASNDDWRLEPTRHADELASRAPELAERLRRAEPMGIADRFAASDQAAIDARRRFDQQGALARGAVLVAGILTAGLISVAAIGTALPGSMNAQDKAKIVSALTIALAVGAAGASAFAASALHLLRSGQYLEEWMTRRAEAEAARLSYFACIARVDGWREPLLALEYVRRFHLDVQRDWLRRRAIELRGEAERRLQVGAASVGIGAAATALAGLLAASINPGWAALAVLGLIAQAVLAHMESTEATALSRRTAKRYERLYGILTELSGLLDDVRARVVAGEAAALPAYVEAINKPLATEYEEWRGAMVDAEKAITALQERLDSLEKERGAKSTAKPASSTPNDGANEKS